MKLTTNNSEQIREIAKQHGLDTIEITSGMNGYPQYLRPCVTGFDTYERAESFAKATGGEVTSIRRRDGWRFAESEGRTCDAYDLRALLMNDYQSESVDFVADKETLDNLQGYVDEDVIAEAAKMLETLAADEFISIINGRAEVCKRYVTHYRHDVWSYDIAVEFDDEEEVEEDE